ncbi:MAG TPA: hypothetical protein VK997_01155 [Deferrisomatales bacterium]|nr:hypothetical protein [Deferrisomatales bacterium]
MTAREASPGFGGWLRRLTAVPGIGLRRALWGETLRQRAAAEAAALVDEVVVSAAGLDRDAVVAYLPLADLPGVAAVAGPGVLGGVLLAARALDLPGCQLLLEHPGPAAAPGGLGPPPDPELDTLTLGHRRAAARGQRSPLLDRLAADPDPRVVREVLRNPRLREREVVAIASRRPCPEAVFRLLAASETWVRRPAVRRAVVLNPHAPPQLALALAVLLSGPELGEVAQRERLHPALRDGAVQILAWRRGAA